MGPFISIFYDIRDFYRDTRINLLRKKKEEEAKKARRNYKYPYPRTSYRDNNSIKKQMRLFNHRRK